MTSAIKVAQEAADHAFDKYLANFRSTAATYVPESVTDAARSAYQAAGGRGEIVVCGVGNLTHPVCSVEVRRAKRYARS